MLILSIYRTLFSKNINLECQSGFTRLYQNHNIMIYVERPGLYQELASYLRKYSELGIVN